MPPAARIAIACLTACLLHAADPDDARTPLTFHIGALRLLPEGFLDLIGMSRDQTTADSISTKFGKIPLGDTPWQSLQSERHSRLMLTATMPVGTSLFKVYLESDFLNFTPGESPYRWRQYYGEARIGRWEILGGQAWSLLRPNRVGTAPDRDIMNTDVIDPGYHVGLIGSRVRQIRISRPFGKYRAAAAWEGVGNFVGKVVRDSGSRHYEAGAFTGRGGQRGATASAGIGLNSRVRLVGLQFWSKRAAYQALGVVPVGANGLSTLEGVETRVRKGLELFGYAGAVYGARVDPAGNRLVRQWSAGVNRKVALPALPGGLMMSLEYSSIQRAVWNGNQGKMDLLMYRLRYTLN